MKGQPTSQGGTWRLFAIPAAVALLGYVLLFACDLRLRRARGGWEVTFVEEITRTPALRIDQPHLGISNVTVRFPGEQLGTKRAELPITVLFNEPRKAVPFGEVAFDDLTYLPGTVVLHCFGHEVQMLPRALFLDRVEHTWQSGRQHNLDPARKLPSLKTVSDGSRGEPWMTR
jgi:hypothetical protein